MPDKQKFVVALMGKKGHGKDTVAARLRTHGFVPMAYADALRREVSEYYGVPEGLLQDPRYKEAPMPCFGIPAPWEASSPARHFLSRLAAWAGRTRSPRQIMQYWGTEYRRNQFGQDYWTDRLFADLTDSPERRIVLTDVRFPNEYAMPAQTLRRLDHQVLMVRVVRPDYVSPDPSTNTHLSETALDGHPVDHTLVNREGDIDGLYSQIDHLVDRLCDGAPRLRMACA